MQILGNHNPSSPRDHSFVLFDVPGAIRAARSRVVFLFAFTEKSFFQHTISQLK
jgi:hypothetical protein